MIFHHPEHGEHEEHPTKRAERFARIRRAKQMLRFMPRRAVMHKYPLIGRFAELARQKAYLWSMRPKSVRPALYAGSILSLLPVMGIQLPLALLLSLLLRANFMLLGGLQFITNPFTAAPIYYATHQLGAAVIKFAGYGEAPRSASPGEPLLPLSSITPGIGETSRPANVAAKAGDEAAPAAGKAGGVSRTRRIATAFNALILGGVISGGILGLVLDVLYRIYWQHHTHPRHPRPRTHPRPRPPPAPDPRSD